MTHSLLRVLLQANTEDYESQATLKLIATVLDQDAPALGYLDGISDQYWKKRRACKLSHDPAFCGTWEEFRSVIVLHSIVDVDETDTASKVDCSTAVASNASSQLSFEKTDRETGRPK